MSDESAVLLWTWVELLREARAACRTASPLSACIDVKNPSWSTENSDCSSSMTLADSSMKRVDSPSTTVTTVVSESVFSLSSNVSVASAGNLQTHADVDITDREKSSFEDISATANYPTLRPVA